VRRLFFLLSLPFFFFFPCERTFSKLLNGGLAFVLALQVFVIFGGSPLLFSPPLFPFSPPLWSSLGTAG